MTRTLIKSWPVHASEKLGELIQRHAHQGEYAVFDADNTIWYQDLAETLLACLENKSIITRQTLDPSLEIIPFYPRDTLVSYGFRLYDLDHNVGYPWLARVFSGHSLSALKRYVDDLFSLDGQVVPCQYWKNRKLCEYRPRAPRIYPAQRALINLLMENGIEVYIITAALEELVRMVASDPKYGINIKPENVIGLTTLLTDPETHEMTTARKQIEQGFFWDDIFSKERHYAMELTPHMCGPQTFYEGKLAALKAYIHPVKQPILAAGDSLSDHCMLFSSDTKKGGLKLWINHREEDWKMTQKESQKRASQEKELGLDISGDKNWIMVRPDDIGIKPEDRVVKRKIDHGQV